MEENLNKAIENILGKIVVTIKHEEALKFSQAVLNLAHAKQLLDVKK